MQFRRGICCLLLVSVASCKNTLPPQPARETGVVQGQPKPSFTEQGLASYYGNRDRFSGRRTASGEKFNPKDFTAAHRTLPFGSQVRVTNQRNGKDVTVRINDRGPFRKGRVIDLSFEAAKQLGMQQEGVIPVTLEVFE